ncbi:MAG TPA: HNH endonuclease signature motif containing protein [Verrucomicrobiae bacterium]|nr:HNH endonuclease signature motif containing protein [Verrucomicrobiae bacterium]
MCYPSGAMQGVKDRIQQNCRIDSETGCWIWQPRKNEDGYGVMRWKGKRFKAHRLAYMAFVSDIPENFEVDHLCRNRACVNPTHLEVVTHKENVLRSENFTAHHAKKANCPKGHPYAGQNLFFERGRRRCRICRRAKDRAYYAKLKVA